MFWVCSVVGRIVVILFLIRAVFALSTLFITYDPCLSSKFFGFKTLFRLTVLLNNSHNLLVFFFSSFFSGTIHRDARFIYEKRPRIRSGIFDHSAINFQWLARFAGTDPQSQGMFVLCALPLKYLSTTHSPTLQLLMDLSPAKQRRFERPSFNGFSAVEFIWKMVHFL